MRMVVEVLSSAAVVAAVTTVAMMVVEKVSPNIPLVESIGVVGICVMLVCVICAGGIVLLSQIFGWWP